MNNSDIKVFSQYKYKVSQNDKYYKINSYFSYLKHYNYRITK
jgi:hypothetical protein